MNQDEIKIWLKENLSSERYEHSLGAAEAAEEIADFLDFPSEKVAFAGLIHDCAKCFSNEELLNLIDTHSIIITEDELKSYKTLHAPVGAFLAANKFKISDSEILNAIRYHTIGKTDMTMFEKIVFLADKIEPYTREKEYTDKLNHILKTTKNIDEVLFACFKDTIKSLVDRKLHINFQSIEIYNHFLKVLEKQTKTI